MTKFPMHPYCMFKSEEIRSRTNFLCGTASEVLYEMAEYCEERKLPFVITDSVSTPEEDKALSRISDEHSTARAFDISIHGWIDVALAEFTKYFEERFLCVAAVGKKSGMPRLIFIHDNGNGAHIHVQVARIYGQNNPLSLPAEADQAKTLKA